MQISAFLFYILLIHKQLFDIILIWIHLKTLDVFPFFNKKGGG